MKTTVQRLYLLTLLTLCFPIGLIFLLHAPVSKKEKILLAFAGILLFLPLFSAVFIFRTPAPAKGEFYAAATRQTLSVGQSGGICVTDGKGYGDSFSATAEPAILRIEGGVYTALQPGVCKLTVTSEGEVLSPLTITVKEGETPVSTVYISSSGTKYHRTLSHGGKYAFPVPEEDAIAAGKTPCKTCYPPEKSQP